MAGVSRTASKVKGHSLMSTSMGGKKYCLLVVKECTDYTWSYFYIEKAKVKDLTMSLLKE